MKKFSSICSILIIAFLFITSTAFSSPFTANVANDFYSASPNGIPTAWTNPGSINKDGDIVGLPNIYQAINEIMGPGTGYTSNADVDHLFMDNDSLWLNFGGNATVIGYSASYKNTLGVYTTGGSYDVLIDQTGQGFAPGYPTVSIGVPDGTVFGWYLEVNRWDGSNVGTFYSESALNPDLYDHMMTFDLGGPLDFNGVHYENPYLIAWEDKPWAWNSTLNSFTLGDEDYNDIIFLVDTTAVPEPASMLLLGSGLLGLAGLGRKRKRAFKNS